MTDILYTLSILCTDRRNVNGSSSRPKLKAWSTSSKVLLKTFDVGREEEAGMIQIHQQGLETSSKVPLKTFDVGRVEEAGMIQIHQQTAFMRPPMGKLPPFEVHRVASARRVPSPGRTLVSSPRCVSSDESSVAPDPAAAPSPWPSPWLFVGLGNPGKKYEGTRHNVGFQMIDVVARAEGISLNTVQFKAVLGKGQVGGSPVLLAKPQTYMNLSGEAIYDHMDLEFAVMKLLSKGGHGGHNGMKSILQHIGNRNTARMRIGIGRPPGSMDAQAFVLQKFSSREKEELDYALERGVQAIQLITAEGLEKAVSTWNEVRKSKMTKMAYSDIKLD